MFTDPEAARLAAKQRQADLVAEAARERLAKSVLENRRNRSPDTKGRR